MADLFTLSGTIAINATVANQTIDATMGKVAELTGTLQVVGDQAEKSFGSRSKFSSASVWVGNMFTKLTTGAVDLGKKLYGIGINYNAGIESAKTNLTTLLKGDTEAATALVEELKTLAKATPLGASGLISNAKELLGYGVQLKDIVPTLEMLGNFALGNQTKLDGIVRAYGQIFSQGMLMAQDANQLVNQDVPIFQILSEHIGGRYEGLTRGDMIGDKENPVLFEDLQAAMVAATSEGGKFYNAMFAMMDTYQGQLDRLGEEGQETTGKLFQSMFENLSNDVLPKLSESLSTFNTWLSDNQESITKFSDAIGSFVTSGFDKMLSAFQWMMENGEAVGVGLGFITAALTAGLAVAHPYAAAVAVIAAAIMAFASAEETPVNSFSEYTQEEIELLNQYHEAVKKAQQAREEYANADGFDKAALWDAKSLADANASDILAKIMARPNGNEMMRSYNDWFSSEEQPMQKSVALVAAEGSEGELQSAVEGYDLEGEALVKADPGSKTKIQSWLNAQNFSATVTLKPVMGSIPGFATGLERVPYDNMLAYLHKDEMVLTAAEAAVYRRERGVFGSDASTMRKAGASTDQPITVNLTVNGVSSNPYEIAGEVRNALELLRWQA